MLALSRARKLLHFSVLLVSNSRDASLQLIFKRHGFYYKCRDAYFLLSIAVPMLVLYVYNFDPAIPISTIFSTCLVLFFKPIESLLALAQPSIEIGRHGHGTIARGACAI